MRLRSILAGFTYLGVRDINNYYKIDNTNLISNFCRDHFSPRKEEEIMVILLNANGLKTEEWKAKNNIARDFILRSNTNIVALQETNMNWNRVP